MADKKLLSVSNKFAAFTFEQALFAHFKLTQSLAFELIELEKLNANLERVE
jgi:hypothetical protein